MRLQVKVSTGSFSTVSIFLANLEQTGFIWPGKMEAILPLESSNSWSLSLGEPATLSPEGRPLQEERRLLKLPAMAVGCLDVQPVFGGLSTGLAF